MRLACFAIPIALTLAACQPQTQSGDVLLIDDFSNPESGFNRGADADAVTDYTDGEYQIEIFTPNLNVWSVNNFKIADAIIEVNAQTAGGSENNLYGLICRHQDDENFYFFAISADGYYAIGKLKEGQIIFLSSDTFQPAAQIQTGQAVNHLAVGCVSQTLSLAVNGAQLAQITDSDFAEGVIGLIAGTFDDQTDTRFDNLLITKP